MDGFVLVLLSIATPLKELTLECTMLHQLSFYLKSCRQGQCFPNEVCVEKDGGGRAWVRASVCSESVMLVRMPRRNYGGKTRVPRELTPPDLLLAVLCSTELCARAIVEQGRGAGGTPHPELLDLAAQPLTQRSIAAMGPICTFKVWHSIPFIGHLRHGCSDFVCACCMQRMELPSSLISVHAMLVVPCWLMLRTFLSPLISGCLPSCVEASKTTTALMANPAPVYLQVTAARYSETALHSVAGEHVTLHPVAYSCSCPQITAAEYLETALHPVAGE
eukprot:scaffold244056_cov18-Tisochrysis_lutea.AAC.2